MTIVRIRRLLTVLPAVAAVAAVALALPDAPATPTQRGQAELATARQFTAGLRTPERATAAGWFDSGLPCMQNPAPGPDHGGMGMHWLRKAPDGALPDPRRPEALVFDPVTRKLVAVEYVVAKDAWQGQQPPSLFGHSFTPTTLPNGVVVYKLHAWIWKPNPNGMFADFNPNVSLCPR
jgi:hypothetical protein